MHSPLRRSLVPHRSSSLLITIVISCALVAGACSDSDTTGSGAAVEADAASSSDDGSPAAEDDAEAPSDSSRHEAGGAGGATGEELAEEVTDAEEAPDPGGEVEAGAGAEVGRDEPVPQRDFGAIGPIVEAHIAESELNGAGLVVVDREEGIVHEQYWGDFGPDRISLIASSTKMITAGVLLHLDDAGLLDVDAPVAEAVPWGSARTRTWRAAPTSPPATTPPCCR